MWRVLDLSLRFVYVALVPFLLPIINLFMPITGMLIGTGIATVIAVIGSDLWRRKVERIKYVGRVLGGMGRLGDFYREHPPKPLVYYIVYPLLLPVILFMRVPRREFLLYRKLNTITLVVVATTGALDYFHHWRPELTFAQFAGATIGVMIMQLIVTFMLIMPIVTTLVSLREGHHTRVLAALLTFMVATAGYGAYKARHAHTMTIMTWLRIEERTKYARKQLAECHQQHPDDFHQCLDTNPEVRAMKEGLVAAVKIAQRAPQDVQAQVAAAREKLVAYYKDDEADAFELASTREALVLFARYGRKPAIWLGWVNGKFTINAQRLPPALHKLLRLPGAAATAAP